MNRGVAELLGIGMFIVAFFTLTRSIDSENRGLWVIATIILGASGLILIS